MITKIAYELIKNLSESIDWIGNGKWAGLVVPMRKMVDKKEKIFPVSHNVATNCNLSDYMDLVPDSTKSAIVYVEKISNTTFEQIHSHYWLASSDLRIIIWYNLDRLKEGDYIDDDIVAANVLKYLPKRLGNSLFTYVKSVLISVSGVSTGAEMFNRYTYDEVRTQFITHPYGAIGIDINVQYIANKCVDDLIPELKCGEPEYTAPIPTSNDLVVTKVVQDAESDETYFDVTIVRTGDDPISQYGQVRVGEPLTFPELPDGTWEIHEAVYDEENEVWVSSEDYALVSISPETITIPTSVGVTITNAIRVG